MEKKGFGAFLKRKNITPSAKLYFVDAMGAMALGLFASLLIGTIFSTIGTYTKFGFFTEAANAAKAVTGAAIGVAIAYTLKAPPLVLFSCASVGYLGNLLGYNFVTEAGADACYAAGPAGAFLAVLIACECGKLVSKETKVDILVTPTVTILVGTGAAYLLCPVIGFAMHALGDFINTACELHPIPMGAIIAVIVGIILTLPISSAAICAMIGITGIAGGAAAAGCCAQMVGFAVISFRENRWSGVVAQGLGTSMLQMGNIVKKPQLLLPVTLASAITGPISAAVFRLQCTGVSAGMGTCGLVGPIGILSATENKDAMFWIGLLLVCVVLPAVLSLVFAEIMRRLGWIKDGDMKLDV